MPKFTRSRITENGHKLYSSYEKNWRELDRQELAIALSKRLSVVAFCGGVIIASLPDGPVDIWGDFGHERAPAEMHQKKLQKRRAIFARDHTPNERFTLSYIGSTDGYGGQDHIELGGIEGNNGVLGFLHTVVRMGSLDDMYLDAGENCLAGTTYDTTPSEIRGRAVGDISAVAGIYAEVVDGKEILTIQPTTSDGRELSFTVDREGFLQPLDQTTINVLNAYGCDDNLNN